MIKYSNAVRTARALIGTPYSEMDCIRLIVMIIRRTPGGDPEYRCEGTNWLWRSVKNSSKYRHLTQQIEGIDGARAGMLAFKRDGEDVHHVGFVTAEGTVIHSSSVRGMVVETQLDSSWHLLGVHKLLALAGETVQDGAPSPPPAGGTSPGVGGEETDESGATEHTAFVREDGVTIVMQGRWRAADD